MKPLRGRIEAVLNRARALGLIDENRANPARWKGHLDQLLPNPKKVGGRDGHDFGGRRKAEGRPCVHEFAPVGRRRQAAHLHPLSRRPMQVDPHLERDRPPARGVQAPRQDPDHPALLLWALLASGLITMRKVDGWQTLAGKPADPIIDLAA